MPMTAAEWSSRSGKFDGLHTEILYNLSLMGFEDDSVGDANTFGYFELFSQYGAILETNSEGFVTSAIHNPISDAERIFGEISHEYYSFMDDMDDEPWFPEYDEYDSVYDSYED
jgi:hypothetical protein